MATPAYTADLVAARELAGGELEDVLAPHLPTKAGLFLYFPGRNQEQPKLRAFIDAVLPFLDGLDTRATRKAAS